MHPEKAFFFLGTTQPLTPIFSQKGGLYNKKVIKGGLGVKIFYREPFSIASNISGSILSLVLGLSGKDFLNPLGLLTSQTA